MPGGRRQSTVTTQDAGITLRCFDASIIVGESVNESRGSTSSAASGCRARARSSATSSGGTSPSTASRNRSTSGMYACGRLVAAERLDDRRGLDERVVGDRGHRRMAAAAADVDAERGAHLLADPAEVEDVAAEDAPLAASLVEREVGAHELGMLLHEPREAVVLVHLLVGGQRQDQVAGGAESLPPERRERDGARRHLALHVERAAPPDLAVDEIARPGVARPLLGIGAHGVGVREQRERGAVAARQPRDEIEPVGRPADELARDPALLEVVAQQLRGDRLVARWVDGVRPQQRLQERRHLLAEGHGAPPRRWPWGRCADIAQSIERRGDDVRERASAIAQRPQWPLERRRGPP